ncbi:MAG: hypothetical protein DRZ90_12095 [Spirochaetes bacterium]|nr:MAG: hypothetical protein DRZ90_12095 [Spirochaetota bacterium]
MKRMSDTIVVDLSAILELIFGGQNANGVKLWLETAALTYAADQLYIELADRFRELVINEKMKTRTAIEACETAHKLIDRYVSIAPLWQEALFESLKYRITAREIIPIILARKLNAGYMTQVDQKRSIAESMGIKVY